MIISKKFLTEACFGHNGWFEGGQRHPGKLQSERNWPHLSLRLNVCEMGGRNVILYGRISQNKNIVFAEHLNDHFQNGKN